MKLLIAIPTTDFVPVAFMQSLVSLVEHLKDEGVDFDVAIEAGTLVYMARDKLAKKAMAKGYTHILWLDSDMVFSPEIVEDLQFCGKDFVSGIAHSRRKPFSSCLFKNIDLNHLERWKSEDYPQQAFRVAGCGFACVLISTDIIRAVVMQNDTAFTPFPNYGEDLSFCKRATALGYEIWAEPTVRCGHIGHLEIWPDDCKRYLDEYH